MGWLLSQPQSSPWDGGCVGFLNLNLVCLSDWLTLGHYPHHFGNFEGIYVFPNQGEERGGLREAVLVRDPRGVPFSHRTEILRNPDRVIYRMEKNGDATYMGTLSHAGTVERNIWGKFIQAKERK